MCSSTRGPRYCLPWPRDPQESSVPNCFARWTRRAATSRTWETLPGNVSSDSLYDLGRVDNENVGLIVIPIFKYRLERVWAATDTASAGNLRRLARARPAPALLARDVWARFRSETAYHRSSGVLFQRRALPHQITEPGANYTQCSVPFTGFSCRIHCPWLGQT